MSAPVTEHSNEDYRGIDTWPGVDVLAAIAQAQRAAIDAVSQAIGDIAPAAEAIAERLRGGGRLAYAGAGSSGILAQLDALELPGTYGIEAARLPVLIAGGLDALVGIPAGAEDDEDAARGMVDELRLGPPDALLALAASGRTPFTVSALRQARQRGALTIGMACNAGTPLLEEADHAIHLATPPEIIAGSTRMNAGTAQKCALNMISTLVGIRLGHAYEGLMVNLSADNAKLRSRAVAIVSKAAGIDTEGAARLVTRTGGDLKAAILLGAGAASLGEASEILTSRGGDVRASLAVLGERRRKAG